MSFILDALKKSENERQRKVGPSLADVHVRSPESKKPWWAVAIAALLLINLDVLVIALTRDRSPAAVQPAPVASTATPTQPQERNSMPLDTQANEPASEAKPRDPPLTSAAVHPLAEEAGVATSDTEEPSDAPNPSLAAAAVPPAGPPMVRPIEDRSAAPGSSPATFGARTQAEQQNEMLPTASDLVAGGTQLPDLHLDIHVYSGNPAERFVFVNMHKYVEGQTLSEGPLIERITPDGAILNQHGLRFLLPRQ
jgi:general secretion pathway protein B